MSREVVTIRRLDDAARKSGEEDLAQIAPHTAYYVRLLRMRCAELTMDYEETLQQRIAAQDQVAELTRQLRSFQAIKGGVYREEGDKK